MKTRRALLIQSLILFLFILISDNTTYAKGFEKSIEEKFDEKFRKVKEPKAKQKFKIYRIKERSAGYVLEYLNGGGSPGPQNVIDVKFKINSDGEYVTPKYFKVYIYDKDKELITIAEKYLIYKDRRWILKKGCAFHTDKTHDIDFYFATPDRKIKYCLAVLGDQDDLTIEIQPNADIAHFKFNEKELFQDIQDKKQLEKANNSNR